MEKKTATEVAQMLKDGAVLVDIRSPEEHRQQYIAGSYLMPCDALDLNAFPADKTVIFHCRSGMRTSQNVDRLRALIGESREAYLLDGGINAWAQAGLPTTSDCNAPLDLMRQVQIVAGSLILLGVLLGYLVSPYFYWLSGFVGAGLLFAGLTGFCGMALLLGACPWNKSGTQGTSCCTSSCKK